MEKWSVDNVTWLNSNKPMPLPGGAKKSYYGQAMPPDYIILGVGIRCVESDTIPFDARPKGESGLVLSCLTGLARSPSRLLIQGIRALSRRQSIE